MSATRPYGRFPARLDAMNMCMWLQAHHLETAYYDHCMQPGAYHDAIAHHMHVWHTEPLAQRTPT